MCDVDEPLVDASLVRQLLMSQCPQWARLPLRLAEPQGSDHVIYRLGPGLSVRLARPPGHDVGTRKEAAWLTRLAPRLPLAIPEQVFLGEPDCGFPYLWSVARWIPGALASTVAGLGDSPGTGHRLARFLMALQDYSTDDLPADDVTHDLVTPRPLAERDAETRSAIAKVSEIFPASALTSLWEAALSAPCRLGPPVWYHGDFHAGNLLARNGRLSAVIDFGALGIGDPTCDLAVAFGFMSPEVRAEFRGALGIDEPTWTRARGWALAGALNAYVSYASTNDRIAAVTTREITDALTG